MTTARITPPARRASVHDIRGASSRVWAPAGRRAIQGVGVAGVSRARSTAAAVPSEEVARAAMQAHLRFIPLHVMFVSFVVLLAVGALSLELYVGNDTHDTVALWTGFGVLGLIVYARYALRLPWVSASIVYLTLFWMFHYGLAFTAVLSPDVLLSYEAWDIPWLFYPNVSIAMILGVIGAAGFVFGVGLVKRPLATHTVVPDDTHDSALYSIGWVVLLVGFIGTAATLALNGGPEVLVMTYSQFRDRVLAVTDLQTWIDVAQLGCLLALCGASKRRWMAPLALFCVFAAFMLLIGLRTEAMVPLVSFVIVLGHRGIHFSRGLLIAAVLASLVLIPAIRMFRYVGFANRSEVKLSEASPLETFTELGGTLRAAKAYVDWIEKGDDYLMGASYWAPFDRQLFVRLVPGREPIPYEKDPRVPGRLIERTEGSVGLSATGEAYYNFGSIGPFIYFGFVGLLFAWLERRAPASAYQCAILGILMSIFFFNIRGHWLPVPLQSATGLALLGICYLLNRVTGYRPKSA